MADVSKVKDTYEIEIREIDSLQNKEDFLKNMNFLYEEYIRKEPEGYLWMHRRFKSGFEESIYPQWSSRERRRERRRSQRKKN